jgi:membrane associated rhomboid family serine protease
MIPIKDRNPSDLFPIVTIAVIGTNVAMFIYQIMHTGPAFQAYTTSLAVVPRAFVSAPFSPAQMTTIITAMFLHGGLLHIVGNMWFLWIFGNNVEDYFGHFKFAVFYVLCGIAATLAHVAMNASSSMPTIGASGAISGVLGAYFLVFPRARVLTLVPFFFFIYFIEVPAFFFLGIYILLQIAYGLPSLAAGSAAHGVAWFAHIGGFGAGIVFLFLFRSRRGFRSRVAR